MHASILGLVACSDVGDCIQPGDEIVVIAGIALEFCARHAPAWREFAAREDNAPMGEPKDPFEVSSP